ncbi:MAG: glycosyltransferase family 2 protein [Bacteroidetes bacterium]|nr:glycosyltransferase family 2 protein [Bacteroidota bacterium]MDA1121652.1 glycosyltransferase family 2 protein [Bacteroidota bacterium]
MTTAVVIFIYILSLALILVFSLGQLSLAFFYKRSSEEVQIKRLKTYPPVTVQLPVYNEKFVVERLIDAVCKLNYPKDKLEIQVLDDSDDETSQIIDDKVKEWKTAGINILQILRENRDGYKAGALSLGMEVALGEFITIFDADFLPKEDFLQKMLPHFERENIGMVQSRWGHLNEDYSILTRMQAFGLDAHFTVEQLGRNKAGSFISFNGTAGIWRKSCIEDAGGWSADTLTEDLDLSYRAQLKGWKFKYLEDVVTPAELPVTMSGVKSQQYRWNKGAAETARKNLGNVFSSDFSFRQKTHASFHLLNSSIFICLLLSGILSLPMLKIKEDNPELGLLFNLGSIFFIGFIAIAYFYWISFKSVDPKRRFLNYILKFPIFLAFSMGLSLHNSIAVLEGFFGIKSPFIRTPKFNIVSKADNWIDNSYLNTKLNVLIFFEILLALYFMAGIAYGIYLNNYALIIFHLLLTIGFASISILSFKRQAYARG